jgi:hypothetical protein
MADLLQGKKSPTSPLLEITRVLVRSITLPAAS